MRPNGQRRHIMKSIWWLALVAACNGSTNRAPTPGSQTATEAVPSSEAAAPLFEWRARNSGHDGAALAPTQKGPTGKFQLKTPGVACEYVVEPAGPCRGATCQFGRLWCSEGGHAVQTRTLCQLAPETPSDSGNSNIRVISNGISQQLDLSCARPESQFWKRARVTMPPSRAPSTPRPEASVATTATSPRLPVAVASDKRAASWKLEVTSSDGVVTSSVDISTTRGDIPNIPAGWRCQYDIVSGHDPGYRALEFGIIACDRGGASFETTIVCGTPLDTSASPATYGLSNVGSLDLSDDGQSSAATLLLTCRASRGPQQ